MLFALDNFEVGHVLYSYRSEDPHVRIKEIIESAKIT